MTALLEYLNFQMLQGFSRSQISYTLHQLFLSQSIAIGKLFLPELMQPI